MYNDPSAPIIIGKNRVARGERKKIYLPMPELYNGSPLNMAVYAIHGKEAGPRLCILAALHGDELNGIEIIRRVLKNNILRSLKGSLIAVPVVNLYGMLYLQRYLMDRRDLNRSFPGSQRGSLASRLAHLIVEHFLKQSTHVIDLHTASFHRRNLPQIRTNTKDPYLKKLGIAFGAPLILDSKEIEGSLRQVANSLNIPYLLYEGGEALRLDNHTIKIGVHGILNVMTELGMISLPKRKNIKLPAISEESVWIRAKKNGLFQMKKKLGEKVHKGDVVGWISDPLGMEDREIITPISGYIIGINEIPLVHEGSAIFHIASFDKLTKEQIDLLDLLEDGKMDENDLGGNSRSIFETSRL